MSKDPALLFYTSDFLTGTMLMSNEEVGIYIRTLCLMHQSKGKMDLDSFNGFVGDRPRIIIKFRITDGFVYHDRLLSEMDRRSAFCESRRQSRLHGKQRTSNIRETSVERMETETETETKAVNTTTYKAVYNFDKLWDMYPKRVGKSDALRHFNKTIKTEKDWDDINLALGNYLQSERVFNGFIQNGSTWFNNWRDWIDYKEQVCQKCKGKGKYTSSTGYETVCNCPKGRNP